MNQTLKDQAKQVEQRLREYRNYKAICTQAADNIAALITEFEAAEADAARINFIAVHGTFGVDSVTGEIGGNGQTRKAATRKQIDAAIAQGAKK